LELPFLAMPEHDAVDGERGAGIFVAVGGHGRTRFRALSATRRRTRMRQSKRRLSESMPSPKSRPPSWMRDTSSSETSGARTPAGARGGDIRSSRRTRQDEVPGLVGHPQADPHAPVDTKAIRFHAVAKEQAAVVDARHELERNVRFEHSSGEPHGGRDTRERL